MQLTEMWYIFNAYEKRYSKKQTVDKLKGWAAKLLQLQYVIEHIPGEMNVWVDLLSRW